MAATHPAWLAGFIDGEGCILIQRSKGKGRSSFRYSLRVVVTQKDAMPLLLIQADYGGAVRKRKSMTGHQVHNLEVNGEEAYLLLSAVTPHLVVKKSQAEMAMKFYELRKSRNTKYNIKYTESEHAEYDAMYKNMKTMKRTEVN